MLTGLFNGNTLPEIFDPPTLTLFSILAGGAVLIIESIFRDTYFQISLNQKIFTVLFLILGAFELFDTIREYSATTCWENGMVTFEYTSKIIVASFLVLLALRSAIKVLVDLKKDAE